MLDEPDAGILVPTIDIREKISTDVIMRITQRIADRFKPQKIILFGSYAYGTPRPESDVDLLVIMDTRLKETQQALEIRQYLNPLFGLDILVYTPDKVVQRLKWGDSLLQEAVSRGKILYESTDA